jgi:hypothetical protein
MRRLAPFLALASLFAGAAPAQQERQQESGIMGPYVGEQSRPGPLHFCAGHVSIEIAADEHIGWQEGPDFDLYFLHSSRGGFGLYQGNHPQRDGTSQATTVSGRPAERLHAPDGSYSYLVRATDTSFPTFIHLYGAAWKGDERDNALLSRVKIGAPADLGCERATFAR